MANLGYRGASHCHEYLADRLSFKNGDTCAPFMIRREEFCLGFLFLGGVNHFRGVMVSSVA